MISERALTTPTSTEQLYQLKEEMEKTQEKILPLLQEKCKQCMQKYMFVSDYMQISPIVTKLQTQAVQWSRKIPYVMEEHRAIIASNILEFQDSLKVSMQLYILLGIF